MRVTEITVSAGRTFNHPYEDYSNLRPHVTLKAEIEEGEDWLSRVKHLQARAEGLVEEHKQVMLKNITDLWRAGQLHDRASSLEEQIIHAQHELDGLRTEQQALTAEQGK